MPTFREITRALQALEIDPRKPVIAHASLSAFGTVQGGSPTLVGALTGAFTTVVMPAFTYKVMVIPETGPPDNALTYGSGRHTNRMAEIFRAGMPADRLMGVTAETLRRTPGSARSMHPILSFCGVNAGPILEAQTLAEPLAPFRVLHAREGWVLLLGVDHTANTAIHYAERLAGRPQFTRWALTLGGVVACPGFSGCSSGFQTIAPYLEEVTRTARAGNASMLAVPLQDLVLTVCELIRQDPLALLCASPDCERCRAVRSLAE